MKLITLNIWGGYVREPLLAFIKANQDIDIWCLQEVYHQANGKISTDGREVSLDIFSEISSILSEHNGFFRPTVQGIYGISTFVRNTIKVLGEGAEMIHLNEEYPGFGPAHPRNLQWLTCQSNNKTYSIMNVHALWNGQGKTDTPDRIAQSEKIKAFVDMCQTPKVLCGDFNLRPDTQSLKMIEKGMINLVKEYKVSSTRTSLYPKEEKFADYIFVSPDISVSHFSVMKEEVSDHAALLVDFN